MKVMFPNEIWMEIFKYIGRQKLMELRLVCHNFYNLIEDLLNKDPAWKEVAYRTIMFSCLTPTMQRAYPYDLVNFWKDITDPGMWRGTFLSYKKWQQVLVNPVTQRTIVPVSISKGISCVCTFDGKLLLVSVGLDSVLRFWDLQNKVEISTRGFFANSISGGECRHLCIGDMDGTLTSYETVENHIIAGPTINFQSRGPRRIVAHTIDGHYMVALAYNDNHTKIYIYKGIIEGTRLIRFEINQTTEGARVPSNLDASMQRFVMTAITFFFGISGNSIGSYSYYSNKWHEYNLGQHFGCHVRSMRLHAQILMFGLDDGSVHLLYIAYYGDVMMLETNIKNSRKIQVDNVPIVDIIVLEVDKKPCIVAITQQRVHLLDFF